MRLPGVVLLVAALAGCRQPTPSGYTLLFFRASSATRVGPLVWAPDLPGSRIVAFDGRLKVVRSISNGLSQPVAVAFPCGHLILVSEYSGEVVALDSMGRRPSDGENAFPASVFSSAGCWNVEARSPYVMTPFATDTVKGLALEQNIPASGDRTLVGALHQTSLPFLIGPENAGALTVDSLGVIYFAPVARDEVSKYAPGGFIRWTIKRGLYAKEEEPRFLPNRGRVVPLLMARAGVALTLGPDGRLYALGADDSTASKLRIDVLDTASGRILLTRHLGPQETAVALDAHGDLVTFDADSLTTTERTTPDSRLPFSPPFSLPDLRGHTIRMADYAGKVTLVNFWASWCDPCREEFPHMAELYGKFSHQDFGIAAISDDVDPDKMRAFVTAFRPPFQILVGGGRMRAAYHYRGLPYSVLLDRRGRVVKRIFGFGGAQEFKDLAAAIAKEIAAP